MIYLIRRDEYQPRRRTWYWADGFWLFDPAQASVYHDPSAAETMAQAVAHQGKLKYNQRRKQDWTSRPEEKPGSKPGVSVEQVD